MRGPHNVWRLVRTGATLERTGAMTVVLDAFEAPRALRILARALGIPFMWLGYRGDPTMPPAIRALTALGPAYIKFGQLLSTRPDVVGTDLAQQLRVLQDRLPPFPLEVAKREIRAELGVDVEEAFSEFSAPVAAASIAQVHRARLADPGPADGATGGGEGDGGANAVEADSADRARDGDGESEGKSAAGREVAVKVLRPGIERAFARDVDAFYLAARVIELLAPKARRLRPMAVIEHFDGIVRRELDLRLESAAASEFASTTRNDSGFRVPQVHWALSARRVMTADWASGTPIGDNAALDAAGHDRDELGERVLTLFLRHALRDGYFHADMHQGNMMVSGNGDIVACDFGIMGHIDVFTRRVYAQILHGFIQRDYKRVAEVHFEAGYVPADRDVDEFARALRAVGEPIFGMDASRISMGRLLSYLFEVTERFGMETRTELILLQRTMVVVEGVARSLSPKINIWQVAEPVVADYIRTSIGPAAALRDIVDAAAVLARFGPRLPRLVESALIAQANPRPPPPSRWPALAPILVAGVAAGLVAAAIVIAAT